MLSLIPTFPFFKKLVTDSIGPHLRQGEEILQTEVKAINWPLLRLVFHPQLSLISHFCFPWKRVRTAVEAVWKYLCPKNDIAGGNVVMRFTRPALFHIFVAWLWWNHVIFISFMVFKIMGHTLDNCLRVKWNNLYQKKKKKSKTALRMVLNAC